MNSLFLRNAALLFFFLSMAIALHAQPGPPYTVHNLNELTSRPINSFKEYYYIDSTTDLNKLAMLAEHEELENLDVKLSYIPEELIRYGIHVKKLSIRNPHDSDAKGQRETVPHDTLKNLGRLNELLVLKRIDVSGFFIADEPREVETPDAGTREKALVLDHTVVLNFPKGLSIYLLSISSSEIRSYRELKDNHLQAISFSYVAMTELPDNLPPSVIELYLNDCKFLRSVKNLALYPGLRTIGIRDCEKVNEFPSVFTQKKLERFFMQLKPAYAGSLLKALQPVDSIDVLELEFDQGLADLDFKDRPYCIGSLKVEGASYGTKTQINFRNTDSLSVKEIYLFGELDEVPDFSKIHGLNILDFGCTVKMSKHHSSAPLAEVKNLKRFTIRNCNITELPEDFFKHNPDLERLTILYTNLKHVSFGETILHSLKFLTIQDNPQLESIPPKRFYPNSYIPNLQRNNKLKEEQN
jgi:Leucine-rich repeat (LRR) protein